MRLHDSFDCRLTENIRFKYEKRDIYEQSFACTCVQESRAGYSRKQQISGVSL